MTLFYSVQKCCCLSLLISANSLLVCRTWNKIREMLLRVLLTVVVSVRVGQANKVSVCLNGHSVLVQKQLVIFAAKCTLLCTLTSTSFIRTERRERLESTWFIYSTSESTFNIQDYFWLTFYKTHLAQFSQDSEKMNKLTESEIDGPDTIQKEVEVKRQNDNKDSNQNQTPNSEKKSPREKVEECIDLLLHAVDCRDVNCIKNTCSK